VIEKKNCNFSPVVLIYDPCAYINEVFKSESRSGGDSAIIAIWEQQLPIIYSHTIPVFTNVFPRAGTTYSSTEKISYPAAYSEPLKGTLLSHTKFSPIEEHSFFYFYRI